MSETAFLARRRVELFANIMSLNSSWVRCLMALSCPARLAVAASNLQWEAGTGCRFAQLPVPTTGRSGFVLMPGQTTGIRFTNSLPETRLMLNQNLLNGSGVALGDYDGDGLCDIYLSDLGGANVLYRNLGNWRFQDVTREAGVACPNQTSTGAVFADINGDGWLDLLVTSMGGPNACFLNDGHGHFTNVTVAAGLVSRLGTCTLPLVPRNGKIGAGHGAPAHSSDRAPRPGATRRRDAARDRGGAR